ncbi:MAG: AI-2E family transporter, partial [Saprospiraceae bacterium]|nr:AI-2E family transporter [Saprospiraceae bacterium]
INNIVHSIGEAGSTYVNGFFKATSQTIFTIGIVPVYVFFMLFYRNKIYRFVLMLTGEDHDHISSKTINEINFVTKKYMQGIVTVVSILCVLNSLGLYLIGMKHFLLLGIIAAIMNFIPYFGTILGFAFPFLVALFLGESPLLAFRVLGLFFVIQFTENNILTPNIVGVKLKINPLIIIISVLLGGRVWGLPGMFVVVPIIGMIKILCDNEPSLKPYGYILGSEGVEKHAISFNFKKKKKNLHKK